MGDLARAGILVGSHAFYVHVSNNTAISTVGALLCLYKNADVTRLFSALLVVS